MKRIVAMAGLAWLAGCAAGPNYHRPDTPSAPAYKEAGEWKPADIKIPEVPTNVNLLAFLFIGIFAQWGVYAAKRQHKGGVGMASGLVGLLGVAVINSLSFVYVQMGMGIADGTYQLFFYAVTGAFLALTIIGVVFSVVTAFRFLGGRSGEREIVTAHAMYWYFLGAMYIVLWFVVFVTK